MSDREFIDEYINNAGDNAEAVFTWFDKDKDSFLSGQEFGDLVKATFDHASSDVTEIFQHFDKDKDNLLDYREFSLAWSAWLVPALIPTTALLIIDVQNDFISGTLALRGCPAQEDGAEVVAVINRMTESVKFGSILLTYDWHPADHISFWENRNEWEVSHHSPIKEVGAAKVLDEVVYSVSYGETRQKLWPAHCIQNTPGSAPHPDLVVPRDSLIVYKGTNREVDCYSGFGLHNPLAHTSLHNLLAERGVTLLFVCGLATDICVGLTCLDALKLGYRVVLVEDACRGVTPSGIADMKAQLVNGGAVIITSDKVHDLVEAQVRPWKLGLFAYRRLVV